ncbi:MAG: hypothetical protein WC725_02100 [Patescibacteria group bacterium]|jgi:hypothetical protein
MKLKKYFYIFSWVVLGLMLSFLAHAIIEIKMIEYALRKNIILYNYTAFGSGYCVLPTVVQFTLIATGVIGGFLAGRYFWRVIYVERRYDSKFRKMRKFFGINS